MSDVWTTPWRLDVGVHTDVGRVRTRNEDAAKVSSEPALFAVADGMGGHRGGDRASNIAVEALHEYMRQAHEQGIRPAEELLRQAFTAANALILEEANRQPEYQGMGTTMTALLLSRGKSMIAHVGDSRAWRIRDGVAEQLTEDHSLVAQQVREGTLTEEEAAKHPNRHVLSRCLGFQESVEIDVDSVSVEPGDIFVLSSDGLVRALDADDISRMVPAADNAAVASEQLVTRACELDGKDNITAVVVACREFDEAEAALLEASEKETEDVDTSLLTLR